MPHRYTRPVPRQLTVVHALEKNQLTTGSVVQMLEAVRGLAARGHRITVVSRPGGDVATACAAEGIPFEPLALRHGLDVVSALRWRARWRHGRPDIVHVHKGRPHGVALMAAAGGGRRPVLVVNRGVTFPLDRFNRWKYRHPRVAAVVCVADAVQEVVRASGGVRDDVLHTIYAGTDTDRFHPQRTDSQRVRTELGIPEHQLVIAQVSVREWKGWQHLLAAFAQVKTAHPAPLLVLIGCSQLDMERVRGAAALLSLGDRVRCLPYRTDMPDVLAACDVVVDASTAGTGITGTIREAMALERAVIATTCGGNGELIADGHDGFLVPPGDPDRMTTVLDQLLAEPGLRKRLGRAARRRIVEGFSTEVRLDRLEQLYRNLLLGR